MSIKVMGEVSGDQAMVQTLANIAKKFPKDVAEQLAAEAQPIVDEMKAQCPVKTGALRDGLHATAVTFKGKTISLTFSDSDGTPYGVYVHENPDAHHDPPTKWKFMEDPLKDMGPDVLPNIGQAVRLNSYQALRVAPKAA